MNENFYGLTTHIAWRLDLGGIRRGNGIVLVKLVGLGAIYPLSMYDDEIEDVQYKI